MSRRVLIVDSSKLMRRLISETLAEDGWATVGEANDDKETIKLFAELHPDAVTLDVLMSNGQGMEALKAILQIDPQAKVVVVSALTQTKLISEAIRAGAEDFIAKPFMPEQLQETLRLCLAK